MKIIYLLITGLVLISTTSSQSQTYVPFPDTNAIWTYYKYCPADFDQTSQYFISGDSIIGTYHYHKLFASFNQTTIPNSNMQLAGLFRKDTLKRVYYKNGYGENLLYDFSLSVGDSIIYSVAGNHDHIIGIDSVLIFNKYRKRFALDCGAFWIEGIGNTMHVLVNEPGPIIDDGCINNAFVCFSENDTVKYLNPNFSSCFSITTKISDTDIINDEEIIIYPNPITSSSIMTFPNHKDNFTRLEIYNVTGTLIQSIYVTTKTSHQIDKKDFIKGVYFFRLLDKTGNYLTGKFLIT